MLTGTRQRWMCLRASTIAKAGSVTYGYDLEQIALGCSQILNAKVILQHVVEQILFIYLHRTSKSRELNASDAANRTRDLLACAW